MLSWLRQRVGQFAFGSIAMLGRAMLTPVAFGAIAIVVEPGGKVVLVRHSYVGGWSLPGAGPARGGPPADAILREMREEIGLVRCDPPLFCGLFTRRVGLATNVIALYRLMNAEVDFRPNLEIREIQFIDPASPPPGTSDGTLRRLAEFAGKTPPSLYW